MNGLKVLSTGCYAPQKVLDNFDLEQMVETSDEWIVSRTGIKKRHIVENESCMDLGYQAALKAIEKIDKNKIGCTLANISLCEYLKLKDLMNLLNNTYKDFDLDYFLQKCKQYQFPLDKKINEFSTGMKTKLNVLIALSHHASFLILDEPTNGLDVLAREEIIDLIREFMEEDENRSVLISSHISSDLEGLCDDIYMTK